MSFFDHSDDAPRRAADRSRRTADRSRRTADRSRQAADRSRQAADRSRRRSSSAANARQVLARRAIAVGVGVLLLALLAFGVRACEDARKKQGYKDYVRDVGALVDESNQQGQGMFALLSEPRRRSDVDLQNGINGFRIEAERLVERANIDRPDELEHAHRYLVETLELRRDGIGGISRELPSALGDADRAGAIDRAATQMKIFLASDVLYAQRVVPALRGPLEEERIASQVEFPRSEFLPNLSWLDPRVVGERIAGTRGAPPPPAPGRHGMGIGPVTIEPGGQALAEGGTAQVPLGQNPVFVVSVANQGEAPERDVTVKLSVIGAGAPIVREVRIATTAAGSMQTARIPLAASPPLGRPLTIDVEVVPVPGEQKTDNNKATYSATFTP